MPAYKAFGAWILLSNTSVQNYDVCISHLHVGQTPPWRSLSARARVDRGKQASCRPLSRTLVGVAAQPLVPAAPVCSCLEAKGGYSKHRYRNRQQPNFSQEALCSARGPRFFLTGHTESFHGHQRRVWVFFCLCFQHGRSLRGQ